MLHVLLTGAQAAAVISGANRICVIGCSGSGKTTLARALGERLSLPHMSMDKAFFWLPGWKKRNKAEERALIAQAVATERWIMDGTGSSSFDLRMPRTDVVLWLRLPRWLCLLGVFRRAAGSHGRVRRDMAPGCPERFPDREFLSYIWNFETRVAPPVERDMATYGPNVPIFTLKSRREVARLLDLVSAAD
ncbi:AAA family ATPase [Rhizobium sp. Leaf384]|uniref:AAA family ATPase n=1 Tax=unclassified Rhizobium TaxID=2613769 RepID=UPI00071560B2|nr:MULTISPECIES: AAA family ATPase [unclassified Rhizobium]KQS74466.1 AAA family ATPase [Rhizobium sp. Leaf383]KQS80204.1 AAA family ATPase [Rhizobium sp. Leaf384]